MLATLPQHGFTFRLASHFLSLSADTFVGRQKISLQCVSGNTQSIQFVGDLRARPPIYPLSVLLGLLHWLLTDEHAAQILDIKCVFWILDPIQHGVH